MALVWSEERKLETWLQVEIAVCETLAEQGVVPAADLAADQEPRRGRRRRRCASASRSPTTTWRRSSTSSRSRSGRPGRWIHFGLTSSDVLDTALALQLREAGRELVVRARTR